MSGIVLSSSVRQNLLSLQSTADLLATTQNRLATGKKVNTALDNPTNFFTASSLDARAGDINNLLDGIGNGVQVLQAANTGITSLQKLVDSAKSVANQALQTTVGFSTKSLVHVRRDRWRNGRQSRRRPGPDQRCRSSVLQLRSALRIPALRLPRAPSSRRPARVNATAATLLSALPPLPVAAADTLTVNGKTITFEAGAQWPRRFGHRLYVGCQYLAERFGDRDRHPVGQHDPGQRVDGNGRHHHPEVRYGRRPRRDRYRARRRSNITGTATRGGGAVTAGALAGATKLSVGDGTAASLSNAFAVGDTLTVNGKTLTFVAATATGNDPNEIKVNSDVTGLLAKIDGLTGSSTASTHHRRRRSR